MNLLIALIASRIPIPRVVVGQFISCMNSAYKLVRNKYLWTSDEIAVLSASLLLSKPRDCYPKGSVSPRDFTIYFIATSKDLAVLPLAIEHAIKSLVFHRVKSVEIYAPDEDLAFMRRNLKFDNMQIEIKSENTFFSFDRLSLHFNTIFPSRGAWCSQQILKMHAVRNSETGFALVVDADTILLRPRPWIDAEGKTMLTPTLEFHKPYYTTLQALGVPLRTPRLSFVPHHMSYDVKRFREIIKRFGLDSIDRTMSKLAFLNDPDERSPFCIDFELYGQLEYQSRGTDFKLYRWANLSISHNTFLRIKNKRALLKILGFFFNSLSVHNRTQL